jgi:hypothetical protein
MAFDINQFSSNFQGGGARASQFEIIITRAPLGTDAAYRKLRYTAKAAALPASTLGQVDVNYFGRTVKLAGDREYADWTVTIMNDEDFLVRNFFEAWNQSLNHPSANIVVAPSGANPNSYKTNASVLAYGKEGNVIAAYQFFGLWCKEIGEVTLSWDSKNTLQEFPVTFAYDYFDRVVSVDSDGIPAVTLFVNQLLQNTAS